MNQDVLQIKKADAVTAYNAGSTGDKMLLKNLFPTQFGNVEDRIWSVEDACRETGRDIKEVIPFPNPINQFQDWLNACGEMAVIMEAFNENDIPDWKNGNQRKWTGWWWMNGSSGSGLSFHAAACDRSSALVASRLHTLSENHIQIIKERFFSICERLMTQSAK